MLESFEPAAKKLKTSRAANGTDRPQCECFTAYDLPYFYARVAACLRHCDRLLISSIGCLFFSTVRLSHPNILMCAEIQPKECLDGLDEAVKRSERDDATGVVGDDHHQDCETSGVFCSARGKAANASNPSYNGRLNSDITEDGQVSIQQTENIDEDDKKGLDDTD